MAKQLDDVVFGGIYEYFRTDNNEIVYRGSTEHDTVDDVAPLGDTGYESHLLQQSTVVV